jgi:hypothetical protein
MLANIRASHALIIPSHSCCGAVLCLVRRRSEVSVIVLNLWKLGRIEISRPTTAELIALGLVLAFLALGFVLWRAF